MMNCLPTKASEKQTQFPRRRASGWCPGSMSGVAGYATYASTAEIRAKQTQFRGFVSQGPRTCPAKQSQLPGPCRLRPDGTVVQNKANLREAAVSDKHL